MSEIVAVAEPTFSRREERGLPVARAISPMEMVAIAVQRGDALEKIEKLMELQERHEKNEARKAYAAAVVAFKRKPITILKNKHVGFASRKEGAARTDYDHATLDNVCEQIIGALGECGLSHSWRPDTSVAGKVIITCVLRHELGHEETVTLDGPPDQSGNKNSVQAIASTMTLLERYSLLAITGLATKDQDDDGNSSESKFTGMSESAIADHVAAMEACATIEELQKAFAVAYKAAEALKDQAAMKTLIRAKDIRKATLAKKEAQ